MRRFGNRVGGAWAALGSFRHDGVWMDCGEPGRLCAAQIVVGGWRKYCLVDAEMIVYLPGCFGLAAGRTLMLMPRPEDAPIGVQQPLARRLPDSHTGSEERGNLQG